ncbi:MAG: response regulator transcription factor [Verrucomicrobiota bacterium]
MKILIVEDDKKTAALLVGALSQNGFEVTTVGDGEEGLQLAVREAFDALLVDIMLPRRDGLSLVRELRRQGSATPVIMISARGEVEQRVEGLNAGADDYLPKPFAMSELMARLRSLLRRQATTKNTVFTVADITYDPSTCETRRAGKRVELSSRERLLLECLLRGEGRVISRRDIISCVWEYDFDPGTNLVDVYIRRLREKIDRDRTQPLIVTVRGLGYALRQQS